MSSFPFWGAGVLGLFRTGILLAGPFWFGVFGVPDLALGFVTEEAGLGMFEPAARAAATTDLEGVVAIFVLDDEAGFVGVECEEDEEGILDGVFVVEGVLDLEGVAGCERGVEGWFLTGVVGKEEKEEVESRRKRRVMDLIDQKGVSEKSWG